MENYPKIAQLKTIQQFCSRLQQLDLELPVDETILSTEQGSPLAESWLLGSLPVGNRWCIHPMEGWDAQPDGSPSPHTLRRWHHFGISGAKLIWGGEAAAVSHDGRANPRQTLAVSENLAGLSALVREVKNAHREKFGSVDSFVVGLQLTHSGRFCRPNSNELEPRIAYHHPLLDQKFGIDPKDDSVLWSDEEIQQLIENYVTAAGLAQQAGFHFVDVKACHGYLLHEFLSARTRAGKYGGDFQGRCRLLKTIIQEIQREYPHLLVVCRLSVFDSIPFVSSQEVGRPMESADLLPYQYGFGVDPDNPIEMDLTEPIQLISELKDLGVAAVNLSCGSPYYNPHLQRPAIFPPSDGYLPPEDPLVGVVRQIQAARVCKQAVPEIPLVGTGYTYLQDFLPQVAQAVVREGWIDSVGLGRMVLSYPELPADTLSKGKMERKKVCRTFSDCTTAPRQGIISGCFPLDSYYKAMPEAQTLKQAKGSARQ